MEALGQASTAGPFSIAHRWSSLRASSSDDEHAMTGVQEGGAIPATPVRDVIESGTGDEGRWTGWFMYESRVCETTRKYVLLSNIRSISLSYMSLFLRMPASTRVLP